MPPILRQKKREADELAEALTDGIRTRTASAAFDAYCRYTYMDNVLRGGYPMQLGNNKIFYVYSRKHGDLERDYNSFPCCRNSIRRETGTSAMSIRTAAATPFCTVRRQKEYTGILQSDPAGRVQSAWRRETDLPPFKGAGKEAVDRREGGAKKRAD